MKRLIGALLVGGALFAVTWAAASTLDVGFGTAATGSGDVGTCGNVTGSTYVLVGQTITTAGNDTVTGDPTDITKFKAVNIETDGSCDEQNAFIQVKDGGGSVIATGSCVIQDDGEKDGLGWDEAATGDNVGGCTTSFTPADVSAAETLVVTIT